MLARRPKAAESLQSSRCLPSEHPCERYPRRSRGPGRQECAGRGGDSLPRPVSTPPRLLLFVLLERSFTFFPCGSPRLRSLSLSLPPSHPNTFSLSLSLSVLSLSPPPCSPYTLDLLAALSKISTPSNTGLPVTSYFIQLEGIKAIKSKRSRQAPVKLSPHGPFPSLFLSFSTKAAPVSPPTASHPHLACFSVWLGLFPAPTVGSEKASDRC